MSGIRPLGNLSAKQSALLQPPGKHLCRTQKLFAAATKSGDQEQNIFALLVRSSSTSQSRMADAPYTSYEVYIAH